MNKLIIGALLALSATASSNFILDEVRSLFSVWKDINQKVYATVEEEATRFEVFYHNYAKVMINNHENEDYKMALNKFADMTGEEFKKNVIGGGFKFDREEFEKNKLQREQSNDFQVDYDVLALPEKWDWREHGAVTPVKDQGSCGSCWAFSATGALEGTYFVKNQKLVSFSEQQLVDCVTKDYGCGGGLPVDGFDYTQKAGIETEEDYPYTATDGKCNVDKSKVMTANTGRKAVKVGDPAALKAAAVTVPVSVGVEADESAFQFYKSGVVKSGCGDSLDHGVLVVGYEKVGIEEAFIVKNSWGPTWGDKGYLRISTNKKANNGNGVCGILMAANVATL